MSFVIDCSVTMAWCFGDEHAGHRRAAGPRDRIRRRRPAIWPLEVCNVLLGAAAASASLRKPSNAGRAAYCRAYPSSSTPRRCAPPGANRTATGRTARAQQLRRLLSRTGPATGAAAGDAG